MKSPSWKSHRGDLGVPAKFSYGEGGKKLKNYYTAESVRIACGFY